MGFWSKIKFWDENLIFNSNGQYINKYQIQWYWIWVMIISRDLEGRPESVMVYMLNNYVRSPQEHLQMQLFAREVTGISIIILMSIIDYSKKDKKLAKLGYKVSRWEKHMEKCPGEVSFKLLRNSSWWNCIRHTISQAMSYDHMCKILSTGEAHYRLITRVLILGAGHVVILWLRGR